MQLQGIERYISTPLRFCFIPALIDTEDSRSDDNSLHGLLDRYRPDLRPFEAIYRHLHNQPELSGQEEQTARTATEHLHTLGYEVHTNIGGHGVAGVLRNGDGPMIMLRADMDALPLEEKTGLPYASTLQVKDPSGVSQPVMHACGHDSHVATLMAASMLLHAARQHWSGTLICVFQPSEEHLDGAQAMLDDGLYDKIPKPDLVLAQHVMRMRAGTVNLRPGRLLTAADAFDVRVFGRGGHGSAPQTTIDPIVIGAAIVMRLQTIVSREVVPGETAVVSCGSINAGHTPNVIPDHLDLQISVRTFAPEVRKRVCAAIHRIIEAECEAGGAVKKPKITLTYSTPATVNDEKTVGALLENFQAYFQDDFVEAEPSSASEDFSLLATAAGSPYAMWTFGGIDEKTWDDAVRKGTVDELPSNHSPFFAPAIQPTLRTGVDALALGALTFLRRK
ncbi:Amidohydrolase [Penicillium hispanicum]|uniref:Amidohydrolase n=1 Tax=Penicillium hispanicum TaxID=1080232 RepID=UPI0025406C59|nr:Amidohydrolase [Penicillium hispanicum]KAJ5594919.1 Amidohydrolase [Penicillium hispanicum]